MKIYIDIWWIKYIIITDKTEIIKQHLNKKTMDKQEQKRVYGEDSGNLTKEAIAEFKDMLQKNPKWAELWAYFLFDQLDWFCWHYNRVLPGGKYAMEHNEETAKDYHESNYARFWVIGQTKHFGVTFQPKEGGLPVYMSESFTKWYHFWKNYIEGLPEEIWNKLNNTFSDKGDLTPYWPSKAWNEE